MTPLATEGHFDATPLPQLLLQLAEQSFSGKLVLTQASRHVEIVLDRGFPSIVENPTANLGLGARLKNQGKLSAPDYERVRALCEQKNCKEEKALLELKLLAPKDLVASLREHMRHSLLDCFSWLQGQYTIDAARVPTPEEKLFRFDPLPLVFEGLSAHWRPEQVLPRLALHLDRYARLGIPKASLLQRLALPEDLAQYLDSFDGAETLGARLEKATSMQALPLLLLCDFYGALDYFDVRQEPNASGTAAPCTDEATIPDSLEGIELPDLELFVGDRAINQRVEPLVAAPKTETKAVKPDAAKSSAVSTAATASTAPAAKASAAAQSETDKLRQTVLERHHDLKNIDFYTLLDVTRQDNAAQIKKAYFKLAKVYHPDALSKHGLGDILGQAGEVFARIAEAHTTLSDPQRRKEYDEALASGKAQGASDADRLANAETMFRKGEVLFKMGQFDQAIRFLKPAIELWPDESEYHAMLGSCLYRKNPPDDALARKHLEKAVELAPKNAQAHYWLSIVSKTLGDETASAKHRAQAAALDKKFQ